MEIKQARFDQLSNVQLYDILKLRVDVFVVEQKCAYEELDNQDQEAIHILGIKEEILVAYARILFEHDQLHIGRIVVKEDYRKRGYATDIMNYALVVCQKNWPDEPVYLSAQEYLEEYYKTFGFKTISEAYDWEGIIHVDMKRSAR